MSGCDAAGCADVQADEVALAERLLQDGDPTITLAMQRAKQLLGTPPAQPTAEAAEERAGREKKGMQEAWPNAQPVPGRFHGTDYSLMPSAAAHFAPLGWLARFS